MWKSPSNKNMAESQLNTEAQVKTIWHLGGLTYRQLGRGVWKEIDHDNVLTQGSALAYNFLLAIFPLLLFLVSLCTGLVGLALLAYEIRQYRRHHRVKDVDDAPEAALRG